MADIAMQNAILSTLAYWQSFQRPLTRFELEQWLWCPASLSRKGFFAALDALVARGDVAMGEGFYFLRGNEHIVETHQSRVMLVEEKMKIALRAARLLRFVPFVRALFVCNTVAMRCPKPESDVDVFIIVRHRHLFTARFFATILLSLFGLRRHGRTIANHVCLSFYHTDQSLNLAPIRLFPDDIYLAYWLATLLPIYDPGQLYSRLQIENAWLREYLLPLPHPEIIRSRSVRRTGSVVLVQSLMKVFLFGPLGTGVEQVLKWVQKKKMARNTGSVQDAHDSRVVISDTMLKFHENDRRAQYREEWKAKFEEVRCKK